jgi:hypothetical protein
MRFINFFNLPNLSGRTTLWGFTQLLTEMGTRSRKIMFLGIRALPVRSADKFTAIGETVVWTKWEP